MAESISLRSGDGNSLAYNSGANDRSFAGSSDVQSVWNSLDLLKTAADDRKNATADNAKCEPHGEVLHAEKGGFDVHFNKDNPNQVDKVAWNKGVELRRQEDGSYKIFRNGEEVADRKILDVSYNCQNKSIKVIPERGETEIYYFHGGIAMMGG